MTDTPASADGHGSPDESEAVDAPLRAVVEMLNRTARPSTVGAQAATVEAR